MFPNKPSFLVYRLVIAKCILFMWYLKDNKNRPYANELIAAVESPCANGGLLTFVLDCVRSASPGSTEIFGRRLARHLLGLKLRCTPTLPTCLQAVEGQLTQLERLNYSKTGIKTIKDALQMGILTSIMEDGQNYDVTSLSLKEVNFMRHMNDLSHALTGDSLYQRDRD